MARLKNILEKSETVATIVTTYNGPWYDVSGCSVFSAQCVVDVNTPAPADFTANSATSIFTAAANGFTTGLKGRLSNSGGGLPTGLSAGVDYFVIVVTANTFKLATSLSDAQAGTALTISTNGTGTQTFTPTSIAGGTVKLQKTNDTSQTAVDEGSATNITADASLVLEKVDPSCKYMRVSYTLTAGSLSATNYILGKGIDG